VEQTELQFRKLALEDVLEEFVAVIAPAVLADQAYL
jgi:hypothetical protein